MTEPRTPLLEQLWTVSNTEDELGDKPSRASMTGAIYIHTHLNLMGFSLPYIYANGIYGVHAEYVHPDGYVNVDTFNDSIGVRDFAIYDWLQFNYSIIIAAGVEETTMLQKISNYLINRGVANENKKDQK